MLMTNFTDLGLIQKAHMNQTEISTLTIMFSQEMKDKTDQLLLTSSVSIKDIVLAKYSAAATVFLIALAVSLIMPMIIGIYGSSLFGEVLCAYIGFTMLGLAMNAIGMFISTTTDSQITAAILTAGIMILLWVADAAISLVQSDMMSNILSWFSVFDRLEPFILGKLSLSNLVYFISIIVLFIVASYINIEKRRWS